MRSIMLSPLPRVYEEGHNGQAVPSEPEPTLIGGDVQARSSWRRRGHGPRAVPRTALCPSAAPRHANSNQAGRIRGRSGVAEANADPIPCRAGHPLPTRLMPPLRDPHSLNHRARRSSA